MTNYSINRVSNFNNSFIWRQAECFVMTNMFQRIDFSIRFNRLYEMLPVYQFIGLSIYLSVRKIKKRAFLPFPSSMQEDLNKACGSLNECVTDQPTDQQTDTASYRGALSHLKTKKKVQNSKTGAANKRKKNRIKGSLLTEKQGRIHGYPSCVRVGRGSDGEGHWGIW